MADAALLLRQGRYGNCWNSDDPVDIAIADGLIQAIAPHLMSPPRPK
jgi:dihydroorotase-like cyclic amidohydrolase